MSTARATTERSRRLTLRPEGSLIGRDLSKTKTSAGGAEDRGRRKCGGRRRFVISGKEISLFGKRNDAPL
ncbi:hypothetical protein L596_030793 [Steinernema carpocapsae]|uniref:Uncharacterized protein n=1 Tax=Steinernema carpocapsae TaxID=34508 RepID=A0A4U5LNU9_STECR|nr:hypothetical protein L596_030793 [Steinernema carpocapsae]